MKTTFFLGFFLSSCLAFSQTSANECSKNLLKLNDWSELSDSVLSCLNSSSDFSASIKELCQGDQRQLSQQYLSYLKYKKEYEDTYAWYQSLSQSEKQSAAARHKLRVAKENWALLGLKDTVRSIKEKLDESYRSCNPYR